MAANASQHDSPTAPIRWANRGVFGCNPPEATPTTTLAERVRLDLLAEFNEGVERARDEYRKRMTHWRWRS